ncbi:micro-fibrillar-associated protein 1 [Syncephalis pseudoplumigaleata]|uniref:Micro-fibrillar-associated protein 1 n=1 Tax=Syncephalis pseudoplumigaleata TaxID=1712513 RepID=A0A4P9YUL1_9FUNG|nr:micro-fibrillar-associated protein 1 [Syncephalis pseudoplumigaleata]|eukprot:RKP23448.1 micro-fibrillar-associated protein 1 [Syncephalis pseudoplumigaleata]
MAMLHVRKSEYTTEYETDEESEEEAAVLLKPVFIPKSKRQTIAEKEQLAQEMAEAEAKREREREERQKAAHQMVATIIKREIEAPEKETNALEDVDDTDGTDPAAELEAWKLRELKRIQRDREEQIKREEEAKEVERRRAMTDAEILREDAEKLKADREKKQNHQFTFMQKYYHKGAFYQEEGGHVMQRDYTAPTQDMPNVELLPSVMQVRDFGKRSQTKWKHLTAEDTTNRDAGWNQAGDVSKRMQKRMAGLKGSTDPPSGKKRRT